MLCLVHLQIGSDGITSFFHCINGMSAPFPLRYLHLGGNPLEPKVQLEQIHTKLHEKIIETQLSSSPASTMLNMSGNRVKRQILLECCLTDRYVHIVTQTLRSSPNWQLLEVLDLSGNEIGEKGAYDVGVLLVLQPPLRVLNLSNNLITGTDTKLHDRKLIFFSNSQYIFCRCCDFSFSRRP